MPLLLERLVTESLTRAQQRQKGDVFSQRDAVLSAVIDMINENIRLLWQEHERLSKEMSIHRHNLFQMLRQTKAL